MLNLQEQFYKRRRLDKQMDRFITIPTRSTSEYPGLTRLVSILADASMDDIGNAFITDLYSVTSKIASSGLVINEKLIEYIRSEVRCLYETYVSSFREPLPIKTDDYQVRSFDDLMFIREKNNIGIHHIDAYVIISEWDLEGCPSPRGEDCLGHYRTIYPDFYKELRGLEVGQIKRLGTSRFERLR